MAKRPPVPEEHARLLALSGSELKTLELAVARLRAAGRAPSGLLAAHRRDGLHQPSRVDQRVLHRLDAAALAVLPETFDAVELAPVTPLGACHVLAGTPQDNVLSATRAAEILADPTVPMALEAAARIRAGAREVRLASCCRAVRMQKLTDPHHVRHFRLFALATAGRDRGSERFACEALREHVGVHLALLQRLGCDDLTVRIADTEVVRGIALAHGVDLDEVNPSEAPLELPRRLESVDALLTWLPSASERVRRRLAHVDERVVAPLRAEFPEVAFRWDAGRLRQATYYDPLCFHVDIGEDVTIADGGLVGWTGALLGDRKQRLFTSGAGLELLASLYLGTSKPGT